MANSNEDVVKDGYKLFSAGDMDGLKKKIFAPDFSHHMPGSSQLAGDYDGPDAAIGLYGKLFELSGGTFKVDLKGTKANGDTVVATHRVTAERDGKKLDQDEDLTFTLKDGKMTRLDEQPSDQSAYDAFWG